MSCTTVEGLLPHVYPVTRSVSKEHFLCNCCYFLHLFSTLFSWIHFHFQVKEFDSISRLDQWLTTMLLRIKKTIQDDDNDLRWFTSSSETDLVSSRLPWAPTPHPSPPLQAAAFLHFMNLRSLWWMLFLSCRSQYSPFFFLFKTQPPLLCTFGLNTIVMSAQSLFRLCFAAGVSPQKGHIQNRAAIPKTQTSRLV